MPTENEPITVADILCALATFQENMRSSLDTLSGTLSRLNKNAARDDMNSDRNQELRIGDPDVDYPELRVLAEKGDWETASSLITQIPEAVRAVFTKDSLTALHIAANARKWEFVEELLNRMGTKDLEVHETKNGHTALHTVVIEGNVEVAKAMVGKNPRLTQICDYSGSVPLKVAADYVTDRQEEMVRYLWEVTHDEDPSPFSGPRGASLLCSLVDANFYDFAAKLLEYKKNSELNLGSQESEGETVTAFEIMARSPHIFHGGGKLKWFWQRWIYRGISLHKEDPDIPRPARAADEENPADEVIPMSATRVDEENPADAVIPTSATRADVENPANPVILTSATRADEENPADAVIQMSATPADEENPADPVIPTSAVEEIIQMSTTPADEENPADAVIQMSATPTDEENPADPVIPTSAVEEIIQMSATPADEENPADAVIPTSADEESIQMSATPAHEENPADSVIQMSATPADGENPADLVIPTSAVEEIIQMSATPTHEENPADAVIQMSATPAAGENPADPVIPTSAVEEIIQMSATPADEENPADAVIQMSATPAAEENSSDPVIPTSAIEEIIQMSATAADEENPADPVIPTSADEESIQMSATAADEENPADEVIPMSATQVDEENRADPVIPTSATLEIPVLAVIPYFYARVLPAVGRIYNKKLMHKKVTDLLDVMLTQLEKSTTSKIEFFQSSDVLKTALKSGTTEFVEKCLEKFPDIIWHKTGNQRILQVAIEERNHVVVNLMCKLSEYRKGDLVCRRDENRNTILHYVAKLAPRHHLNLVLGAPLQMHKEMQWFEGVKNLLPEKYRLVRNKDGETAQQIFTREHKTLVDEAGIWLKGTSESCMLVNTLIATVTFAAAITVPGGNNADSESGNPGTPTPSISPGLPIFLPKILFLVFAIADALSLFSSITSVLMFLSILTSRYVAEDFLTSLPRKLILGLLTLFFSLVTLMVAFGAALAIVLEDRLPWWAPIIVAWVPVAVLVILQLPLFIEMVRSICGHNIFIEQKHRPDKKNSNKEKKKKKKKKQN